MEYNITNPDIHQYLTKENFEMVLDTFYEIEPDFDEEKTLEMTILANYFLAPFLTKKWINQMDFDGDDGHLWEFAQRYQLEELKTALKPMEFAINKIGKQDMNLIKAEGVYKTVVESLEKIDSDIAKSLKESFLNRVDDRRPVTLVHLILFLHNPD